MEYLNAKEILPPDLLEQVKKYAAGKCLYVPQNEDDMKSWGELSGYRERLRKRNQMIINKFRYGVTIEELSKEYFLSEETVKKIVYSKKKAEQLLFSPHIESAKEYDENGLLEEWIQLFLRNDGKNIALADGLLLEKREYFGLKKLDISLFEHIKAGAPEYLSAENDIEYFFWIVENMKNNFEDWDVPPLIVEYREDKFIVNDGRHRLEMFRQLSARNVDVVLWTTGEENKMKLREVLG